MIRTQEAAPGVHEETFGPLACVPACGIPTTPARHILSLIARLYYTDKATKAWHSAHSKMVSYGSLGTITGLIHQVGQSNRKKINIVIVPDPDGHWPQHPCAQCWTDTEQGQTQAIAGELKTRSGCVRCSHDFTAVQSGRRRLSNAGTDTPGAAGGCVAVWPPGCTCGPVVGGRDKS